MRRGVARRSKDWIGKAVTAGLGRAWLGEVRHGRDWQLGHARVGHGKAGTGEAWQGTAGAIGGRKAAFFTPKNI